MDEKKLKKLYEKNMKILNEQVKQKGNKYCADCCEKGPKWGSPALGIFLCLKCAGFHRKMGSIVKSIALDNWSQEETETMIDNGNDKVNSIFLNGSNKPLEADYNYIKDKYERRIFSQKTSQQKSDMEELLLIMENMGFARKSLNLRALDLSDGNVQEAIELLLSGALGDASTSGKRSKGKSRAESEEPQVERTEVNLPKLSAKKISPQDTEVGSSMDSLKMPELRKERVNDSHYDISKDERIKQALENAMRQLASFGFTDISDTKVALRQARGDVEKALSILVKWKDERVLREYKQQNQQDDTKKTSQPNILGSMDNISQSGYFHHQPTHLQPLAYNQVPLDLANQPQQISRFDQQVSQSYQNNQTMPLAQNTLANQPQQISRFDQQVSQSYQNNQTMPLAQNTLASQPQQIQKSLQFDVSQTLQPTQQSLQAAPQAQQHPIDLFFSDQFNHAPALQATPIQPSVKVFDLLGGSSSSTSCNNPFAAKHLLPTVNGQKNDNQTASVIKSSNSKESTFVPYDLVGLSFIAAGANQSATTYPAKSLNDQNIQQPVVTQNITGPQGKSSKDTIMSLFSATATSQLPLTAPSANHMPINPFMMSQQQHLINQQQSLTSRSQPRLSLTKTANPPMNAVPNSGSPGYNPANMGIQNNLYFPTDAGVLNNPNYAAASQVGNTNSTRNYQFDNYLEKSEIFSAPPPPPSEKEKIQASLFSDLSSYRR